MEKFDFNKISKKWQKKWAEAKIFDVKEDPKKKKYYVLEMFPYPSGSGLHMGHAFNYIIGDVYTRFKRMNNFNVLYPMGYDSFGLPAENAAIKAKTTPKEFTTKAINNFIKQQKSLGLSYDWNRMISTCQPEYYKWNQYFFLKFLEKGLVYRKEAPVNWCPECNTVLANEQVHDGRCWRHKDTEVEKKFLEQWFIKTTAYADELLDKIPGLDWPERIKIMQENWIGKSYGATLKFDVVDEKGKKIDEIETFTTRPDTSYGITYLVLAAEHPKVIEWTKGTKYEKEVKDFIKKVEKQSIIERTAEGKEKNGVFLGKYFINPFTGDKCPLWVADYALYDYGTGAVMAVPVHDQRDFEFAKKYKLPLKVVISPPSYELDVEKMNRAYEGDGKLVNSEDFNGMNNRDAIEEIGKFAEKKKWGKRTVNYKLKDWLVSRQRYWGTPIPIVHCKKCGLVPVPEKELPVKLPEKVTFGAGNPLESSKEFVDVKCPKCKAEAKRETDTMDTFFDSSWYFLRYTDPKNTKEPFKKKNADYWMPVDQYIGGAEHACMHLIYARFFTKALRDMKFVKVDEPFKRLFNQGMLHGEDGHVMSKSRGNVVLPETVSEKYGIDTARFFLVSIASPDKDLEWSAAGVEGSSRFMKKVMNYFETVKIGKSSKKTESKLHKAIKGVTEDIENFKYNLAVIKIRELFDSFEQEVSKDTLESFLKLFHPFCPHITEELWEKLGNKDFLSLAKWPKFDPKKIDETAEQKEEAIHQILSDIRQVQELTGKEELKKITFITAAQWKYKFFKELKKQMEKTRNVGEILKTLMATDLKKYSGEISKMVPKLIKNPARIPKVILNQKEEAQNIKNAEKDISEQFKAKLEIIPEEKSKEAKAKQAMPGKPAILVD
ncbi:leucine--tRNA ligase [Candidatus Woesearchaeota archaeon]|nr:leucine--tRNA ligase [Candidatus Woesearchaeota archaeon]MBW3005688.1 leucine--tRNA ligase [Candidatus Woesearchaeota archaeon]